MTTHQYIADAAQLKGFREGTISQIWVPFENQPPLGEFPEDRVTIAIGSREFCLSVNNDDGALKEVSTTGYRWVEFCPYAVGDELAIKKDTSDDMLRSRYNSEGEEIGLTALMGYYPITSVEAKTLGEMTIADAVVHMRIASKSFALPGSGETKVHDFPMLFDSVLEWWNTRYPEQPWDSKRWCWVLGIET